MILLVGSLIVIYIGANLLRTRPTTPAPQEVVTALGKTIVTAFVVTWCNPQAIIDGTMLLGAFHVSMPASSATPFITGVALASVIWFSGITLLISHFKNGFNAKILRGINLVCGLIILLYGAKLFWTFTQLAF